MTKQEKALLAVLACIQFTHIVDFMIIMPLGPKLMDLFSISPQQFGFVVSSYTISAGIFGFLGAFIVDRFDRKMVLLTAYIGFVLGTFACALAPGYHALLLARIFTGAFGGVLGAQILAIIGDVFPYERRATAMATVMASFSLASVLGVPGGIYIADRAGWHMPFLVLGALGILLTATIFFFVPGINAHVQQSRNRAGVFSVITDVLHNRNQLNALLLMTCLMFGQFSVVPFISPYMVANVGFTQQQLAYIYLLGGALSIFSSQLIGRLADKHGKYKVFTILVLASLVPLFGITNMPPAPLYYVLPVTTLFFIFAGGRMIPASTMITSTAKPQNRGSFMSINSSVQQLAAGIAAFISGAIISRNEQNELENYEYVGYIAIVFSLLCVLVASRVKPVDGGD